MKRACGLSSHHAILAALLAIVFALAVAPCAYADIRPDSALLQVNNFATSTGVDVSKEVATVDTSAKNTSFKLTITDRYSKNITPSSSLTRTLYAVNKNGQKKEVLSTTGSVIEFKTKELGDVDKLYITTKADFDLDDRRRVKAVSFSERYSFTPNITFANGASAARQTKWSIGNEGFKYRIDGTPFKFVNGTEIGLNAIHLPVTYKHNSDGTTIVGIGCNAEDKTFYEAVKNRNVWQKYSSDEIVKKTQEIDKGYAGQKLGAWGKKGLDWSLFGYGEFNTKKPNEKWTVTLCGRIGIKVEGHAQYLIFTADLTANLAAELMASLTRNPQTSTFTGALSIGALGRLELYFGLGCQYIASIGAYGAGTFHAGLDLLPAQDFGFNDVYVSGETGVKAKAFGFTIFTWKILEGKIDIYKRQRPSTLKAQALTVDEGLTENLLSVDASIVYPEVPRDYVDKPLIWNGDANSHPADADEQSTKHPLRAQGALAPQDGDASDGQSDASTTNGYDLKAIAENTYSETDVHTASAGDKAIMVFIADANQFTKDYGIAEREDANRGLLVYSRYDAKNNTWSNPTPVQSGEFDDGCADFDPAVCMDSEGNAYVAWLNAKDKLAKGKTLGEIADNLNVNVARIDKGGNVTIKEASAAAPEQGVSPTEQGVSPSMPRICIVNGKPTVAWYTNECGDDAHHGQVIGVSGTHKVYCAQLGEGQAFTDDWTVKQSAMNDGAVTSFELGEFDGKATCAWTINKEFDWEGATGGNSEFDPDSKTTDISNLELSDVYCMSFDDIGTDGKTPKHVAGQATNAQFAKKGGQNVLTFYQDGTEDANGALKSWAPGAADSDFVVELPGDADNAIPLANYLLIGDLSSFAMATYAIAGDGSTDIHAQVLRNGTWAEEAEVTNQDKPITFYSPFLVTDPSGGSEPLPVFVFSSDNNSSLDEAGEGSASVYCLTGGPLQRLSIEDITFDDTASMPGDKLSVDIDVKNSGTMPISSIDAGIFLGGTNLTWKTKELPSDKSLAPGEETTVSVEITLPAQEAIEYAKGISATAMVFPTDIRPSDIARQDKTLSRQFTIGDANLTANATHLLAGGQESVKCAVMNEGMAAESGTLTFENAITGKQLASVKVPTLNAHEKFEYTYKAPKGLFRTSGVEQIRMTVKGKKSDSTDIACQESIVTWAPNGGFLGETYKVGGNVYKVTSNIKDTVTLVKAKKAKTVKVPAKVVIGDKPYKVTAIGKKAFAKAKKKVKTVTIGKNVKTIRTSAFAGCKKLKKVKGGKGVTVIAPKAFKECRALKKCEPTASKKLVRIGKLAFQGTKKLKTITIKSKKLKKKAVKGSLKQSSVKTVRVKAGKAKTKKYKRFFTQKNCGKRVTV